MNDEAKGTPRDPSRPAPPADGRRGRLAHCRACGREFWKVRTAVGIPSAYCTVRCRQEAANARKRQLRAQAHEAARQAAAGGPPPRTGGPPAA